MEYIASEIIIKKETLPDWSDVVGLKPLKDAMIETIILPQRFPQLFIGNRLPFRNILFYGQNGIGKTLFGLAVAKESKSTLFYIRGSTFLKKWPTKGDLYLKAIFRTANYLKNSIIFIDEIEHMNITSSIDHDRRTKHEFLISLSSTIDSGVNVLISTTMPNYIDAAVRRRIERRYHFSLPDEEERKLLIEKFSRDANVFLPQEDIAQLVEHTNGLTHSDIRNIIETARNKEQVDIQHLVEDCKKVPLKLEEQKIIEKWQKDFGTDY